MRRAAPLMLYLTLLLLIVRIPDAAEAQGLSGRYVYHGAAGEVTLVLEEQGGVMRGALHGADGSVFQLEGQVEAGRSTGRILLGNATGWYAAGFVAGGLKMIVAEVDGAGQPDLSSAWELDFVPVTMAAGAAPSPGTAPSSGPAPARGSVAGPGAAGGIAPQREDTQLLREWLGHLRGKQLKYMDSYSSNDPIGGSGGYSDTWEADLCSDGTFLFRSRSTTTADVGGVSGYSAGAGGSRGVWRLVEQNGQAVLQYRMEDGTEDQALLTYRDGKTYFGNQRVFVTDANQVCR